MRALLGYFYRERQLLRHFTDATFDMPAKKIGMSAVSSLSINRGFISLKGNTNKQVNTILILKKSPFEVAMTVNKLIQITIPFYDSDLRRLTFEDRHNRVYQASTGRSQFMLDNEIKASEINEHCL